jgi:hypothetical protein
MVVVVVLPLPEFVVEDLGVVDDNPVEQGVELLGVDAVGALDSAVKAGSVGFDLAVADPFVEDVIVERGLEFSAVVGLDDLYRRRKVLHDRENDRRGGGRPADDERRRYRWRGARGVTADVIHLMNMVSFAGKAAYSISEYRSWGRVCRDETPEIISIWGAATGSVRCTDPTSVS